eukprot:TRINITY_DN8002_c0_g1_i6.p1 TRINITY_DN8002_c0_g1~~TRINITY_DN8002_c0_g1_i6.p1  ORF type:complete len:212 (+),score=22.64 TRINITY_DN8002_c0_g1_i6:120-755(+)
MNKEKPFLYLYIIGTNGSVIFDRMYAQKAITSNESIQIASTLHTIDAMTSLVTPPSLKPKKPDFEIGGKIRLETVATETLKVNCFETLTGLKFVLVTTPGYTDAKNVLRQLYEVYSDFVSKDPFYPFDQPIKNKYFEAAVKTLLGDPQGCYMTAFECTEVIKMKEYLQLFYLTLLGGFTQLQSLSNLTCWPLSKTSRHSSCKGVSLSLIHI